MYFSSLQGHATSCSPGARGAPTECTVFTQWAPAAISRRTSAPTRVMMPIEVTAYALSVTCTPMCERGPPTGPIEKGTTYIVRPRMLPWNKGVIVARISDGGAQLLVGPASSSFSEAMKVRPSVRATSLGCERAR